MHGKKSFPFFHTFLLPIFDQQPKVPQPTHTNRRRYTCICGLLVAFHLHACGVYVCLMLYVSITIESIKVTHYDWCLCFAVVLFYWPLLCSQILGSNSGLFLFGRHILFLSLGHLRGSFFSSLHCFGTKINRVVTSKFDYWVCLFFFVYSWWVDKISMIYKMNHLAITIQINESWVHQNHRVTMIAAKSAYSCNLYHNITD